MKAFRAILIVLIVLTGIYRFTLNFSEPTLAASIDSDSLMQKINAERANRNITKLVTSPKLVAASSAKTDDMFARGYFDHVDPDGHYVWPRVEAAGYKPYRSLGENLAIDFSTEDGIVRAWIDSPTHRDNMLRAEFLDQGLTARYGTFQNRYTNLVTSLFGTLVSTAPKIPASTAPKTSTAPVTPAPAPPPAAVGGAGVSDTAMTGKNEPAVALAPVENAPDQTKNIQQPLNVINPKNLKAEDVNVYETVRTIFLALVILLFGSVIVDGFVRGNLTGPWKGHGLPVMLLLIIATVLTISLY